MKRIASFILRLSGWHVNPDVPAATARCVMIAAPHTSNWDFIIARLVFFVLEVPVKFTIKKEWMKFPFNILLDLLGAIPIDRSPKIAGQERRSMTEAMIELFKDRDRLAVMITPEGTRSKRTKWRTGFYYIAKGAGVPIVLGYLDYKNKEAGVGKVVVPGGEMEKDMKAIMDFYKTKAPKHPAKFSVDLKYE